MSESVNMESHLTSAVAFVEGGIQDACDDSCSICLEAFVDSDPSTVTSCKHEFHLQCILEWCQRSAQCPMCWQDISLKDPISQELLEAVDRERSIRSNQTRRNTAIFHHPALGDFDLQHLSMGANDDELEERIIQHLAAAASMGRAHHLARREGQRARSSARDRNQFLFFSAHPNASSTSSAPASSALGEDELPPPVATDNSSAMFTVTGGDPSHQAPDTIPAQSNQFTSLSSAPSVTNTNGISAGQSTPIGQDRAGPSDFQAFSESLKSRLNSVSTRYKESITKSTRGWKERLFSRNTSVADIGSEVKREVTAGIATVTRIMERLDTRESRTAGSSGPQNVEGCAATSPNTERVTENTTHVLPDTTSTSTACATSPK